MGVVPEKPKIEPVVIHDFVKQRSNAWPVLGLALFLLIVAIVLTQQKRSQDRLVAAIRQEPTYVVSDLPLLKGSSAPPPQLAKTASIATGALPAEPPKTQTTAAPESETSEDTTADDTDAPATTTVRQEGIQLSNVQLASESDGDGHEIAMGTATLYNNSPYEVTDYELYISAAGGSFRLQPFTGSADNPTPLTTRTIAPGGRITVPIMTNGIYTAGDPGASKVVSVEATENGVTVNSHVTVD
jgi:hypothetical protein